MIDEKYIEQILDRCDIVDVVSEFVELRKKGANYEACCPFHTEKTPSFIVSPARNTWHCFGQCQEGGNAISFLMKQGFTFRDAVNKLAGMYGVIIEENRNPPSDEEIRKTAKRESLFVINEAVTEFYKKQLPKAPKAFEYAIKRWGKKFVEEMEIGYAPDLWDSIKKMAEEKGLSLDLMLEIGLLKKNEKGNIYDIYRNRIIIPIRDRYRRVIGFTARDLSGKEGTPKYMNSSSSEIYNKNESIFGIDIAQKQSVKEDRLYCVEGAPDVLRMQSIGINNTVASLGSAWTDNQFKVIKKLVTSLCFLPDADPLRNGESYGTGIAAVIKNGTRAMRHGFNVSVREIPVKEGNIKQDPDSFCTSISKFNLLEEEDFILWFARYQFLDKTTTEDIRKAIAEICILIALIDDEVKEDMYIQKLQGQFGNKAIWTKSIKMAKKMNQAQRIIDKGKKLDRDLYKKYGFYEDHNSYYCLKDGSGESKWSNFIMEPMFHIRDSLFPKRLYKIKNEGGQEEIIEMKQEDLISLAKFKVRVEGLGNYIWLASEKELTKLKMFLYEQTETALEITQLGWQRGGFFAYGNGVYDTEWHAADEYGIVRLGDGRNYYLPGASKIYRDEIKLFQFERRFVHLNYSGITLHDYAEKMISVFGDNAKIGICFLLATLFRDIVVSYTKIFPILNLFGPKGSGKSEMGHSLMGFFIIENSPPNIQNSTIAALADTVAQCANALVHIDELKNSIDIDKREFLKGLWDGSGRNRMNMDRDKKREITKVDSGIIVSGQEMATADIALFSRFVYLIFKSSTFNNEEKRKFDELVALRKSGLSHLTLQILRHRSKMEQYFSSNYKACMADLQGALHLESIEDRIFRNWLIVLATFRTLEGVLSLPFTYNDILKITTAGIILQNEQCNSNNELANFWNMVSYLQQDGEIFIEGDYRIDYLPELKSDLIKEKMVFKEPRPILMMRKARIFMLYKKFGKMVGDSVLPEGSLRFYLENSKEYLGQKNSVRFKNIQHGNEVVKFVNDGDRTEARKTSSVELAMCFDYELIKRNYSINLEVETE